MAISLVQSAGGAGGSTASASFSAATSGNLLVAYGESQVVTSLANLADPSGWTMAVGTLDASSLVASKIWYKTAAGGETGITISSTGSGSLVEVAEFTGFNTWTLDKTNKNSPAGAGTTCSTGSTGTLSQSAEVAFVGVGTGSIQSTRSWDTGFSTLHHGAANTGFAGYLITAATTAINPTATFGTSDSDRAALIATFFGTTVTPVNPSFTGLLNVGGTVNPSFTGLLNVAAAVNPSFTGLLNVGGPLASGWKVTAEVAWSTNPLTRPASGDWTVLTEGIKSLTIKRGTKILSSGIETGTATAVLENTARNIDPDYAASPYAPNVIPRRRIRFVLRDASGTLLKVLHTGFIERYQRSWALDTAYVTLPTQDLFGVISGANLPISVLDYVTQQLGPDAYYPLGDQSGATLSADEMGNNGFAAYGLPLQASGLLTNYDTRTGMTCARPTGSNLASQNVVRFPYSVPQTVTVCAWFRHIPGDDVTMNPTVFTLQDGGGVPFTFTGSPGHNAAFLSIQHTLGGPNCHAGLVLRDPSNFSGWASTINYSLLDGNPHFLVASINGTTKAISLWVDGANQGALSNATGVPLSSMNVSGILSGTNMFAAGWGISWDSASTADNQSNVGQLSIFQRILTDAEVLSMWTAGSTAWKDDTTDVRLGRICDMVGVDASDRSFATGTQQCGPTILGQQNALSYIKKIVATEQGACFVNGNGQIRFTARPSGGSPTQIFSDDPTGDGGAAVEPWQPDYGWDRLVTQLQASIESGVTRTVRDATAYAKYGPLSGSVGGKIDTLAENINDAVTTAQWVITGHKNPTSYVPSVKVSSIDKSVSQDALLSVEVADLVAVIGRPPSPTVAPIGLQAEVEYVQYDFPNPTEMTATFSPGDGSPYP